MPFPFSTLPMDLQCTVISKLPTKERFRFKAVARQYNDPDTLATVHERRPKAPFEWVVEEHSKNRGKYLLSNLYRYSLDYTTSLGTLTHTYPVPTTSDCHHYRDGLLISLVREEDHLRVLNLSNNQTDILYLARCKDFDFCFVPSWVEGSLEQTRLLGWRSRGYGSPLELRRSVLEGGKWYADKLQWKNMINEHGVEKFPKFSIASLGLLFWKWCNELDGEDCLLRFDPKNTLFDLVRLPPKLKELHFSYSLVGTEEGVGNLVLVEQLSGETHFSLWIRRHDSIDEEWQEINRNLYLPFPDTASRSIRDGWEVERTAFIYHDGDIIIVVGDEQMMVSMEESSGEEESSDEELAVEGATGNGNSLAYMFAYSMASGLVRLLGTFNLPVKSPNAKGFMVKSYMENPFAVDYSPRS